MLWWAWRDPENDTIPDQEPPILPNAKNPPQFKCNCHQLYDTILLLRAAVCLLATCTVSMAQACTGRQFLAEYCQHCLRANITLTINHHASIHIAKMIKRLGPVYLWWLFALEHFNGILEHINHNGHDGGCMELTLMRSWVQTHLIYEYLLCLHSDAYLLKKQMINSIIKTQAHNRGSMMTQIAIYQSEATANGICLPLQTAKFINL